VPHDQKSITWENSFIDFVARHTVDELLPNQLDDHLSIWICDKIYPIAVEQAKVAKRPADVLDFKMNGFVVGLIGKVITRATFLNNWDDNLIARHVATIGNRERFTMCLLFFRWIYSEFSETERTC
jgi:hypothetical protein